jgi:osmotically-inducible protein OsmY
MDMCTQVSNAIHWAVAIPRCNVLVEADGGLVTLNGVVDRDYEKSCAEAIARRVPGVIDVRNRIAVRAGGDLVRS